MWVALSLEPRATRIGLGLRAARPTLDAARRLRRGIAEEIETPDFRGDNSLGAVSSMATVVGHAEPGSRRPIYAKWSQRCSRNALDRPSGGTEARTSASKHAQTRRSRRKGPKVKQGFARGHEARAPLGRSRARVPTRRSPRVVGAARTEEAGHARTIPGLSCDVGRGDAASSNNDAFRRNHAASTPAPPPPLPLPFTFTDILPGDLSLPARPDSNFPHAAVGDSLEGVNASRC
ncbi:unnamed protein product [Lampetra fluviatilis]